MSPSCLIATVLHKYYLFLRSLELLSCVTLICMFYSYFPYPNIYLVVNRYIPAIAPIAAHNSNWWNSSDLTMNNRIPGTYFDKSLTRYAHATQKGELVILWVLILLLRGTILNRTYSTHKNYILRCFYQQYWALHIMVRRNTTTATTINTTRMSTSMIQSTCNRFGVRCMHNFSNVNHTETTWV